MHKIWFMILILSLSTFAADEVLNGKTPKGTAMTIEFKEELRFGADEDEDAYLWPLHTADIAVDDAGTIYVANTKDNRISQFNDKGEFVKDIAIPGQGPGELQALISFQILADGSGVALEGKPGIIPSFSFFDKDMKFVRKMSHQFGMFPVAALLSPDGKHFGARILGLNTQDNTMTTRFGILTVEPEAFVKELSSYSQKTEFARFQDPNVLSAFIGDILKGQYSNTGHYAYDQKGNVYTAVSNKYEITKWTPGVDKKLRVIKREYKPAMLSEEEVLTAADVQSEEFRGTPFESLINDAFLKKVMARADLPPVKVPVSGLLCMPNGYLLVVHHVDAMTGKQVADIFSDKGIFVGQVAMPDWAFVSPSSQPRMVFRNGKAYTLEMDEEGDNRVARYSYKMVKGK